MVKRLRHHPFTVVTGVRFPLESPTNQFRALFGARFLLGISPLLCVSLCDPQQAARSRALALAERRFPLESPINYGRSNASVFYVLSRGISPLLCVSLCDPHRLHARHLSALAERRFPLKLTIKGESVSLRRLMCLKCLFFNIRNRILTDVTLSNDRRALLLKKSSRCRVGLFIWIIQ